MSRAINEVLQYSQENEITCRKHWIIVFRAVIKALLTIAVTSFAYLKWSNPIGSIIEDIEFISEIGIPGNVLFMMVIILVNVINAIIPVVKSIIEYKTFGLTLNNITLSGGGLSLPLDNIHSVQTGTSFWGRIFGYGIIQIFKGETESRAWRDMADPWKFQAAIDYFREACKEGRNIRSEERVANINYDIAKATSTANALIAERFSQSMVQAITTAHSNQPMISAEQTMAIEQSTEAFSKNSRFCTNCGKPLLGNVNFCSGCGNRVTMFSDGSY